MWAANPDGPVDCGRRLLPVVIDQRARDEPDSPWCSLPVDDYDLAKGFEDISISRLAKAINQLAWFIESAIGRSSTFETVAYLGVGDIRYHMMQMAVCKTGHKILFSSQVNSKDIHLSLMEQTQCNVLFSGEGVHVGDLLAARPLKHVVIPDLEALLNTDEVPHYPYDKTFDEARNDPFLILHTSGTTGMPKPIIWNHAFMATQDRLQLLGDQAGRKASLILINPGEGVRYLFPTPPPHALPEGSLMVISVFNKAVIVPGFRHRITNPSDLSELIPPARCTKGVLTPWMMEDIARRPDAGALLKDFESVAFGGAVLSASAAKVWAKYTKIQNIYGCTESVLTPSLVTDDEDFDYIYFNTFVQTLHFRPVQNTGHLPSTSDSHETFELVMTTTEASAPVATWYAHQNIDPATMPPPYPEWHTGDLFTPHPDPSKAAYAWKFVCRQDDLISFSTGVIGNPTALERAITDTGATSIRAAIVVGDRHQQSVAVLELAAGVAVSADQATALWDAHVRPANELAPTHVRVARTHVLLVPEGTFVRTGKGSVVRNKTQAKLAREIEEVYERFGDEWHDAKDRYGSISQTTSIVVEIATDGE